MLGRFFRATGTARELRVGVGRRWARCSAGLLEAKVCMSGKVEMNHCASVFFRSVRSTVKSAGVMHTCTLTHTHMHTHTCRQRTESMTEDVTDNTKKNKTEQKKYV